MFMTVCRNGIRCRGKFHLIGTLGDNAVAGFYAGKDLYLLAVVGTEGDELFLVPLLVQLQVDEEATLFLGQCAVG